MYDIITRVHNFIMNSYTDIVIIIPVYFDKFTESKPGVIFPIPPNVSANRILKDHSTFRYTEYTVLA